MPLNYKVFQHSYIGFNGTSTLFYGAQDAILIDACFTLSDAHRLAAALLETRKNITHIYVSHFHPDHHFGLVVLQYAFPDAEIIEVPVEYQTNLPGEWEGFESACGVNLNSVLTYENIYVPIFNMVHDEGVVNIIKQNTTNSVIPINAEGVCAMGGSVRCLTWQLAGENAEKLILAAREE